MDHMTKMVTCRQ